MRKQNAKHPEHLKDISWVFDIKVGRKLWTDAKWHRQATTHGGANVIQVLCQDCGHCGAVSATMLGVGTNLYPVYKRVDTRTMAALTSLPKRLEKESACTMNTQSAKNATPKQVNMCLFLIRSREERL